MTAAENVYLLYILCAAHPPGICAALVCLIHTDGISCDSVSNRETNSLNVANICADECQ